MEGKIAQTDVYRSYTVIDKNNVKCVRISFHIYPS